MSAPMQGKILRDAEDSDGDCRICEAELGHIEGYCPVPATFVASLVASDYEGLNMGIEEDAILPVCWECANNCVPWAPELEVGDDELGPPPNPDDPLGVGEFLDCFGVDRTT